VEAVPAASLVEPASPASPETTPEPAAPLPAPEPVTHGPTPEIAPSAPESTPAPREETMSAPAPEPPHKNPNPSLPHTAGKTFMHSHAPVAAKSGGATTGGTALSSRPRYLSNPKPDYPSEALWQHQEGSVLLSVDVSSSGQATDVILKRSSGFPLLDQSAIRAVRRWTFQPAQTAGLPVSARVEVPVRFSLSDTRR